MQSRSVLLSNMFDPEESVLYWRLPIIKRLTEMIFWCRETERGWDKELAEEVRGECEDKYGPVVGIKVEKESQVCCRLFHYAEVNRVYPAGRNIRQVRLYWICPEGRSKSEWSLFWRKKRFCCIYFRPDISGTSVVGTRIPARKYLPRCWSCSCYWFFSSLFLKQKKVATFRTLATAVSFLFAALISKKNVLLCRFESSWITMDRLKKQMHRGRFNCWFPDCCDMSLSLR